MGSIKKENNWTALLRKGSAKTADKRILLLIKQCYNFNSTFLI
ncbi:hypothetical protein LXL04_020959 [Taraxacum kok-saghyz]